MYLVLYQNKTEQWRQLPRIDWRQAKRQLLQLPDVEVKTRRNVVINNGSRSHLPGPLCLGNVQFQKISIPPPPLPSMEGNGNSEGRECSTNWNKKIATFQEKNSDTQRQRENAPFNTQTQTYQWYISHTDWHPLHKLTQIPRGRTTENRKSKLSHSSHRRIHHICHRRKSKLHTQYQD